MNSPKGLNYISHVWVYTCTCVRMSNLVCSSERSLKHTVGDWEESGRGVARRRRHLTPARTHELWQWGIKSIWGCEDVKETSADRTWQWDGHHGREGGISVDFTKKASLVCSVTYRDIPDKPEQAVTLAWFRPSQTGMLGWTLWFRKGLHWISGRSWNIYSGVIVQAVGVKLEEERRRYRPGLSRADYKG